MICPTAGRPRIASLALCLALGLAAAAGCGKKGAPLAPLIIQPRAPEPASVRAAGDTVSFQFRVPDANVDETRPADLARVDVYGYTGQPPADADLIKLGTRVASVPVRRPPEPESGESGSGDTSTRGQKTSPDPDSKGFDQGDVLIVSETLGPAQRAPVVSTRPRQAVPPPGEIAPPLQPPAAATLPTRLYSAVGVSRKGRRGPFTAKLAVPLAVPPSPPSAPVASYDEKAITLAWVAPPDLRRPTLEPAGEDGGLLKGTPLGMPSSSGGYNVYAVSPEAADLAAPQGVGAVSRGTLPTPLNKTPLTKASFQDPSLEFGSQRCYVVRAVSVFAALSLESAPSPAACVTPADTFPPAPPANLAAVGTEGAISLIWEASTDADLQGYLVLRGEGGGELQPVTPEPIKETTYRDTAVKAGAKYVYVVVAVDTAGNRSGPSNRVEETARGGHAD